MLNYFLPIMALYILWNVVAFLLVMVDKRRARRNEWRIREQTFFFWAVFFGAAGILLGMQVFHHKTRHWSFTVGMPLLFVFNIVCSYLLAVVYFFRV